MFNNIVVACGVACVHTLSVFVCLTSKYSIPGSQEWSFKWFGMVKKNTQQSENPDANTGQKYTLKAMRNNT